MFTRRATQVMTITTIGASSEGQRLDGIDVDEVGKIHASL